jgi:hypothetical protein
MNTNLYNSGNLNNSLTSNYNVNVNQNVAGPSSTNLSQNLNNNISTSADLNNKDIPISAIIQDKIGNSILAQ